MIYWQKYRRIGTVHKEEFRRARPGVYVRRSDGKEFSTAQLNRFYVWEKALNRPPQRRVEYITTPNGFRVRVNTPKQERRS